MIANYLVAIYYKSRSFTYNCIEWVPDEQDSGMVDLVVVVEIAPGARSLLKPHVTGGELRQAGLTLYLAAASTSPSRRTCARLRRSGALAMRDMYMAIKEGNLSPLIAPDGSAGPPHEFKPGAIMLARLSGSPVGPISFACSMGVKLRTWDRLLVPLPFSRIAIEVGEPIELEPIMAMSESPGTVARMGDALTAAQGAAGRGHAAAAMARVVSRSVGA